MLVRLLTITLIASMSMAATCNKEQCSKKQLDKCDLHMKQIIPSPDGQYMAVSSQRICGGHTRTQEVNLYKRGEAMSNACGNVYITTDTSSTVSIEWIGPVLTVSQPNATNKSVLLKTKKLFKLVDVDYRLGK